MTPRAITAVAVAAAMLLGARPVAADDARVRIVEFDPKAVLSLTAFVGYHVHLEFDADERFVSLGAGDSSAIDVGAEGNHLLIKPRLPMPGTNLTILTTKHAYYVDYRALARAPRPDEAVYSVTFHYPQAPVPVDAHADAVRPGSRLDSMPSTANRNYWFCGSPKLKPIAAADDGLQLQLRFAPDAELPAIYAVSADGGESLVNTHSERDTVFVHRLAPRFVLRRGREVGCVVDRSDRAAVRRADGGTVDVGTDRVVTPGVP